MSISFLKTSLVVAPGQTVSVSQLVSVSASSSNPAYLVLNAYDRNEYAATSSDTTGSFYGNSRTLGFSTVGGDARGAGIVFTYMTASARYFSASYGYLDQLSYTASTSSADVTDLSLFGTTDPSLANRYVSNAIALAQRDAAGYIDTLTIAAERGYTGVVPAQATPRSIAAVAQSFVGAPWNADGCWVLASTISAEAGASLPVQSAVDMAGVANGEWFVAYNGPAGSTGDWVASVRTGDMIGFITSAGTGHITTCVSGYGSTAMVIDNIRYVTPQGVTINNASDGSSSDVVIEPAHAASLEWPGVMNGSVVIFRLDTPLVVTLVPTLSDAPGGSVNLADVFVASDPAGRPITLYQAYTARGDDGFTVNGISITAVSAASAVTASSLSEINFDRGAQAGPDVVTVRAYNGAYWGDWATITTTTAMSIAASNMASGGGKVPVYRFFDTQDGTHFFTASASEAETIAATRSDLASEGIGLTGYGSAAASSSSTAVFRFFVVADGTHFYTASTSERDALVSTRSSEMTFEGIAFYENATPQDGDMAVYRFFDTIHGTHLFTQSASERSSILATRPDLVAEGLAFYAPG